jgi:predicted Zn-dependent protease
MHRMAEVSWSRFNDLETALKWAREARTLAPNDPDVALLLGRLARETGDYTWSMDLLQDASGRSPSNAQADLELATSSFLAGNVAGARTAAEAALRKQPSNEQAARAHRIVTLLRAHENPDPTMAAGVAEAWQQEPGDPLAQMAMARLHLQGNRRAEARKVYEEALKARPGFIPAMKGLALLLGGEPGQEERSFELATAAQRVLSDDPQLNRLLGILSCKRENFARSAQLLTQSIRQQPGDAEAHFYLGVAQHKLNRVEESAVALERAIALDGQAAFVAEARRLLEDLR